MGISTSIRTCFQKYSVFSGRATRSEYWWFYFFTIIGSFLFSIADEIVFGWENKLDLLGLLFSLGVTIPMLSVTSRRLHDIDRSGKWQLLPYAVTATLGIMHNAAKSLARGHEELIPEITSVFVLIAFVLIVGSVVLITKWLANKGIYGPNRFGADPLDGGLDTFE